MLSNFPFFRACIDTSEEGDLEKGVFLGEYSRTHEYKPLTQEDQLNVSINVHDDGNVLEIVNVCCKLLWQKIIIFSHVNNCLLLC